MARIRRDIAKLGGPWSDTMLWYARAVGTLWARPLRERTSWLYLAAIHGFDKDGWTRQRLISATTPTPRPEEMGELFDQCQHAGWFFLPWHRGYLAAFEAILADWIESNGGPDDWALPYWNYLNSANAGARDIPQEFLDSTLPGTATPNPLAHARRGPATRLGPQPWIPVDISLAEQTGESVYTSIPGTLGYGGPISGFTQQGNAYGGVESNPHNYVHVMVGGDMSPSPKGWMYDPNFAALDPVFWVHHCNIDRLWAAWMTDPGNSQEKSQAWRNGPFPRQFSMPTPTNTLEVFVPGDTLPGERLDPSYDDLVDGTGIVPPGGGGPTVASASVPGTGGKAQLLGTNATTLSVGVQPVASQVSLAEAPGPRLAGAVEKRYYLNVEGVRGKGASGVLTVEVGSSDLPGTSFSETLVFFGLANASNREGFHAGNGLSATVEITKQLRDLESEAGEPVTRLDLKVKQPEGASEASEITVDRISVYER